MAQLAEIRGPSQLGISYVLGGQGLEELVDVSAHGATAPSLLCPHGPFKDLSLTHGDSWRPHIP